ncbi:G-protein coupled receptor moody-like [Centruroides vittatus]|uniref:G-protein coupled receptor moody-like n=1 Tax=Centruroides vittatus TaxID=120091 RepID=UPI00350FBFB9
MSGDIWSEEDDTVNTTNVPLIREKQGLMHFAAFCVIVIIIVGITGNLLTIIALLRCPRVRSATATFIISLCLADFLFCSINLPFSASRFIHQKWIHGDTLCVLFPFLRYANVGLSLLSITAITVNRYILISHQHLYDKIYRKRYIALMIVFVWTFSIVMLFPTLLGKWGRFGYDPTILNCSILEKDGKSPKTFLFVLGFVIPCIAIVVCYARIFWVVRSSQQRMRVHSETKEQQRNREMKQKKDEWRITKMVLFIFCSFLLCYLPITIVKVADKNVRYPELHIIGYILIYLSACINPIIYGVTNKQYRQAYKTVLLCRRPRTLSVSGTNCPAQQMDNCGTRTMISMVVSQSGLEGDSVFEDDKL